MVFHSRHVAHGEAVAQYCMECMVKVDRNDLCIQVSVVVSHCEVVVEHTHWMAEAVVDEDRF